MAILAHALPSCACCSARTRSSSNVHSPFLMEGSKWLCHLQKKSVLPDVSVDPDYMRSVSRYLRVRVHLSRHCFPMRPGSS